MCDVTLNNDTHSSNCLSDADKMYYVDVNLEGMAFPPPILPPLKDGLSLNEVSVLLLTSFKHALYVRLFSHVDLLVCPYRGNTVSSGINQAEVSEVATSNYKSNSTDSVSVGICLK